MKLFASQLNSYQQQSEDLVLDCFPIQNHTNSASSVASSESPADVVTYGVILEDSCLYPEGGGQPWDLGTIDGHDVVSVESTPKGLQVTVKHPFPIGSRVVCKVDWNRRYDFMQQHSCQHLLSATIHQLFGVETVKWELGRANVAVDFQKDSEFTTAELETIEQAMNFHIRAGQRITASVADRDSLSSLSQLRGAPKGIAAEFDQLRIISIDGYDSNPCGGTHLATTAEIQMFKLLLSQEKERGAIRLRFLSGNRILRALGSSLLSEMDLSRLLCIQTSDIVPTVTSLFAEKKELVKQVKGMQDELAGYFAQELVHLCSRQYSSPDSLDRSISRSYIIQHRPGATLPFLQLTAEIILQMNEAQSLGIQAIYLSGSSSSEGNCNGSISSSASGASSSSKKKKGKGASTSATALPLPPTEFSLVIPPAPQSGAFIFYSPTTSLVDQLKGDLCALLEGKAGGRPGKLQGQGQALQNIVAIDELLGRTLQNSIEK